MSYSINDIVGIGPDYAERLRAVGIRTTARLLEAAKSPKGRKHLAAKTGLDEKRIQPDSRPIYLTHPRDLGRPALVTHPDGLAFRLLPAGVAFEGRPWDRVALTSFEAVREFLKREGTCLVLGPHHDVGVGADRKERNMEYAHHGDALVPRQQRFGKYTRSLMQGLGIPVENRYGLRPAVVRGTNQIAPLAAYHDLDSKGWLKGVTAFNFHMHLPHYALLEGADGLVDGLLDRRRERKDIALQHVEIAFEVLAHGMVQRPGKGSQGRPASAAASS